MITDLLTAAMVGVFLLAIQMYLLLVVLVECWNKVEAEGGDGAEYLREVQRALAMGDEQWI